MSVKDAHLLTDEELVLRITATNDTQWFGILYDRYADVVFGKCLSFTKDRAEAEDLAHDVFLKLFMQLKKFSGKSKFSTWLYSFTYHHCVNHVNRVMKKRPVTTDMEGYDHIEEPEDKKLLELQHETLAQALERLDPEDKMLLLLKYQDEMSVKQIMAALDIGESAVKMRLKRAKVRCVKAYNDILHEPRMKVIK